MTELYPTEKIDQRIIDYWNGEIPAGVLRHDIKEGLGDIMSISRQTYNGRFRSILTLLMLCNAKLPPSFTEAVVHSVGCSSCAHQRWSPGIEFETMQKLADEIILPDVLDTLVRGSQER